MQRTRVDLVDDPQRFFIRLFPDVHSSVEVSTGLKVVKKVAPALDQQIVVDRIFFVDRDLLLSSPRLMR